MLNTEFLFLLKQDCSDLCFLLLNSSQFSGSNVKWIKVGLYRRLYALAKGHRPLSLTRRRSPVKANCHQVHSCPNVTTTKTEKVELHGERIKCGEWTTAKLTEELSRYWAWTVVNIKRHYIWLWLFSHCLPRRILAALVEGSMALVLQGVP